MECKRIGSKPSPTRLYRLRKVFLFGQLKYEIEQASLLKVLKMVGNEACDSRVGVVTPDCSGGRNPAKLASICPAISEDLYKNNHQCN